MKTTAAPPAVVHSHMDPTAPVPVIGDHVLLSHLGPHGIEAFLRVVGEGSGSPLVNAELRHLGGTLATHPPHGGALIRHDIPPNATARYAQQAPHSTAGDVESQPPAPT
ncbi:hypothetical protein [Streptomyces lydicus]|uniref:hypothetical protein n=1 Tax=Streptomyces lydicus TaxID=47763 RepID=UPI0037A31B0C